MAVATISSVKKKAVPKRRKVTYGSVTVLADVPSKAEVEKNITEGKAMMERLLERLETPGIPSFVYEENVPYYWADPNKPSHLIRRLNDKEESGVYDVEKGEFVVCE